MSLEQNHRDFEALLAALVKKLNTIDEILPLGLMDDLQEIVDEWDNNLFIDIPKVIKELDKKDDIITDLNVEIKTLESKIDSLEIDASYCEERIDNLKTEISELQTEISILQNAKLD